MDAKTLVSVHISRLQDLLSEVATTNNPTFVKEVVTAIKDLHLLEQSLQDSERQKKVSSVVKAIYSAEDITDSLLIRKRENNGFTNHLLDKKESQATKKRENNGFKKKLKWPLTYFKSSHSQDEFALELEKFRTEITALSSREDFFCSNNDATLGFLNKEDRQSQPQSWGKFSGYCSEETNVVGFEQQIKDLVARLIPEMDCNRDLSSTRDHSSEGIMEIPAEQDVDDHYTQVIVEIVEGGSGKTNNNHCDENPSDLDPSNDQPSEKNYFWMSLRSACERGHFIIPGIIFLVKTYLRRFLRKTVIPLLQSSIDSIEGQEGNHSTNQVIAGVGEEIQEVQISEQDSNHSTNQVIAGVGEEVQDDQIPEQDGNHSTNQVISGVGEEIQEDQIPEQDSYHSTNQVIAVVGEAGSGKSTLVRTMYNRIDVKQHFPIRAWFRASSESKAIDFLYSILKQINKSCPLETKETFSEKELKSNLQQQIKDINYLLVIEDVETAQVWKDVLDALNSGGKIIITSRSPDATADANSTLLIPRLNNDESWKLFSKEVPLAHDHPEVLSTIVKEEILKVCDGFPLSLVLLGGLLSTKGQNDEEWSRVIENAKTDGDILGLSYKDLPSQVKPCFLYMGLFPKEYEIPVRRLIHLWCAEGFVTPDSKEMVPEELAELYFQELVIRNLIQVRWRLDGRPKTCRMHDHLHDIFSKKAADVGFFYKDQFQTSLSEAKQPQFAVRRLAAAYFGENGLPSSFLDLSHLHSCVVFDIRVPGTPASDICGFLNKIVANSDFALLTVFDLEGVYKPTLSDAVEKLLQLRYLGLRSTFIDSLPSFVGFLPYLETLDLKHTKIENLPSSIWKAKKLQHLYLDWSQSGAFDLRVNLTSLRKLGLTCHSTSVLKIITQLTKLQSLKVKYIEKKSVARFRGQGMAKDSGLHLQLQSMDKLQDLYLKGKLEKEVIDIRFLPPNLRILTLSESRLEDDPMTVLEKLPNLNIVRLFAASYIGREIKCSTGGFPELHVLKLWKLEKLEHWTMEEGAMPCLRELEIRDCNQLQLPTGLQHLTNLKEIALTNMKEDFHEEVTKSLEGMNLKIINRRQ